MFDIVKPFTPSVIVPGGMASLHTDAQGYAHALSGIQNDAVTHLEASIGGFGPDAKWGCQLLPGLKFEDSATLLRAKRVLSRACPWDSRNLVLAQRLPKRESYAV